MFTQIVCLTVNNLRTTRQYIQNFAFKNSQKISAFMMASKMFSVAVLFALIPLDSQKVQARPVATEIKFDQSQSLAVVGKNRQVAITTAQSNLDMATKSSAPQIASANDNYSELSGVERDPSYFRGLYQRAGAAYNVPWQLIEAVHYVETGCSDSTNETSYAGATGPMQFMPGTWRTYASDGDGDGSANIYDVEDAVFGAANLLAQSGAAEGDYQSALFNYNHAQWYVDKVIAIARDAGM